MFEDTIEYSRAQATEHAVGKIVWLRTKANTNKPARTTWIGTYLNQDNPAREKEKRVVSYPKLSR